MGEGEVAILGQDVVLREKDALKDLLKLLPRKAQLGFSGLKEKWTNRSDKSLMKIISAAKANDSLKVEYTCMDVNASYITIGCNLGIVFMYNREANTLSRFICENKQVPIVSIKLLRQPNFLATGQFSGAVTIFQYEQEKSGLMKVLLKCTVESHHEAPVTSIQWTHDGTKLFTADSGGNVAITVINMDEGKTHTVFICREDSPVTQLSFCHTALLISTLQRTLIWPFNTKKVVQVGKQSRKVFGNFGACFFPPPGPQATDDDIADIYAARPGLRLWKATMDGKVLTTMIFKDSVNKGEPIIETLELPPRTQLPNHQGEQKQFGTLIPFDNQFLVSWQGSSVWVMDPGTGYIIGCHSNLGYVTDVAVCNNELYVLSKGDQHFIRKIVFETRIPCIVVEELDLNGPIAEENEDDDVERSSVFQFNEDQDKLDKLIDEVGSKMIGAICDVKSKVLEFKPFLSGEGYSTSEGLSDVDFRHDDVTSDENNADGMTRPFESSNELLLRSCEKSPELKPKEKPFDHLSHEAFPKNIVFEGTSVGKSPKRRKKNKVIKKAILGTDSIEEEGNNGVESNKGTNKEELHLLNNIDFNVQANEDNENRFTDVSSPAISDREVFNYEFSNENANGNNETRHNKSNCEIQMDTINGDVKYDGDDKCNGDNNLVNGDNKCNGDNNLVNGDNNDSYNGDNDDSKFDDLIINEHPTNACGNKNENRDTSENFDDNFCDDGSTDFSIEEVSPPLIDEKCELKNKANESNNDIYLLTNDRIIDDNRIEKDNTQDSIHTNGTSSEQLHTPNTTADHLNTDSSPSRNRLENLIHNNTNTDSETEFYFSLEDRTNNYSSEHKSDVNGHELNDNSESTDNSESLTNIELPVELSSGSSNTVNISRDSITNDELPDDNAVPNAISGNITDDISENLTNEISDNIISDKIVSDDLKTDTPVENSNESECKCPTTDSKEDFEPPQSRSSPATTPLEQLEDIDKNKNIDLSNGTVPNSEHPATSPSLENKLLDNSDLSVETTKNNTTYDVIKPIETNSGQGKPLDNSQGEALETHLDQGKPKETPSTVSNCIEPPTTDTPLENNVPCPKSIDSIPSALKTAHHRRTGSNTVNEDARLLHQMTSSPSHVVNVKISHQRQGSNVSVASVGERCKEIRGEALETQNAVHPPPLSNRLSLGEDDTLEANIQHRDEELLSIDCNLEDSVDDGGTLYPMSPFPAPQVPNSQIYSQHSVNLSDFSLNHFLEDVVECDPNNEVIFGLTSDYDRIDVHNDLIESLDSITDVEDNICHSEPEYISGSELKYMNKGSVKKRRLKGKYGSSFNSPCSSDVEGRPQVPADIIQERLRYLADSWAGIELPTVRQIQTCACSDTLIWVIDNHDFIFYASTESRTHHWRKLDGRAMLIASNQPGTVVWCINRQKTAYYRTGVKDHNPAGSGWEVFERDMHYIAADQDRVWAIKTNGDVFVRMGVSMQQPYGTGSIMVKLASDLVQVSCLNGLVWALDIYNHVQIFTGDVNCVDPTNDEKSYWCELPGITASHVSLGSKSVCWLIDREHGVWFNQDIAKDEDPLGGTWYQLSLGDGQTAWFSSILNYYTAGNEPKAIIANERAGVLILGKQGTLNVAHGHLLGTRWDTAVPPQLTTNSWWSCVSAAGSDMNRGFVWALQPSGELFCFKSGGQSYKVHPPNRVALKYCSAGPRSLWALTAGQDVYVRLGISDTTPQGLKWFKVDMSSTDNGRLKSISCGNQVVWAVDYYGNAWFQMAREDRKAGLTPTWVSVEDCPLDGSKFVKIAVGPDDRIVWACDDKNNVYARKNVTDSFWVGTNWEVVSGTSGKDVTVSSNHVWALCPTGDLLCRFGVSSSNVLGDYWKKVPGSFEQISVSPNDEVWGIDRQGHLYQRQTLLFYGSTLSNRAPSYNDLFSDHNDWEFI